jgi:hypothetical protein
MHDNAMDAAFTHTLKHGLSKVQGMEFGFAPKAPMQRRFLGFLNQDLICLEPNRLYAAVQVHLARERA